MKITLPKRALRFAIVGVVNAVISFGILNLVFYKFQQGKIVASIVSTTCALMFSFIMNRGFVFGDKTKRAHKQLPAFVLVTISGSLLILNMVYIASLEVLSGHEQPFIDIVSALTPLVISKNFVDINLSTALGALVAMFWNYNGYKWFVFKGSGKDVLEEIDLTT